MTTEHAWRIVLDVISDSDHPLALEAYLTLQRQRRRQEQQGSNLPPRTHHGPPCPVCGRGFDNYNGRKRYDRQACRQLAYRQRTESRAV